MRWPTSRTSDIGFASDTPSRLRAPFCWSVAATANRKAAINASVAAIDCSAYGSGAMASGRAVDWKSADDSTTIVARAVSAFTRATPTVPRPRRVSLVATSMTSTRPLSGPSLGDLRLSALVADLTAEVALVAGVEPDRDQDRATRRRRLHQLRVLE